MEWESYPKLLQYEQYHRPLNHGLETAFYSYRVTDRFTDIGELPIHDL